MEVNLKTITPNAEVNIVEIARVSSSRKNKAEKPEGLINYLIKNKHWSPFEHAYMTIEIKTSKAMGIQMLRHRSFTFQEFSQRYAEVNFIEDIEFRMQAEENRQSSTVAFGRVEQHFHSPTDTTDEVFQDFLPYHAAHNVETTQDHRIKLNLWLSDVAEALANVMELYKEGLQLGVAKECARMILPMASQTTLYMTGSIRSWIHLFEVRDDGHAQLEAQLIARAAKKIFCEQCPIIAKARGYIIPPAETDAEIVPS